MQAFEIQPPAVTQCTSRPRPHFTSSFIGTRTAHLGRGPGPSQLAVRSRDRPPLELSTARRPRELPVPAAPSRGAPLAPDSAVPAPAAPAVPGPAAAAARSPPLPSVTAGGSPGARMGGTAAADPESACSLERPPLELSTSRRPGGSPGTRKGGMATAEPESGRLMDRTSGICKAHSATGAYCQTGIWGCVKQAKPHSTPTGIAWMLAPPLSIPPHPKPAPVTPLDTPYTGKLLCMQSTPTRPPLSSLARRHMPLSTHLPGRARLCAPHAGPPHERPPSRRGSSLAPRCPCSPRRLPARCQGGAAADTAA